jgi:SAM-dependent methyltransferase
MTEFDLRERDEESREHESLKPTGERYLPWAHDPVMAYEHLHRYAYLARHVQGKSVLDLGSGEGYGTALLARTAARAVGIEIDPQTVHHARLRYQGDHLYYLLGSVAEIPLKCRFDVVVCFEVIEHIRDHEKLLREVKRILAPGGLFVVSTPNRPEYRILEPSNPFHVKELDFEEFRGLLASHFAELQFLGQRVYCGSSLWPANRHGSEAVSPLFIDRTAEEFVISESEQRNPLYFIGLASDSALGPEFTGEVFLDSSNSLLKEKERVQREQEGTIRSQKEALAWRQEQVNQSRATIDSQEKALEWRATQISDLHNHIEELNAAHQSVQTSLEARIHSLESHIQTLDSDIQILKSQIRSMESSRSWQLTQGFVRVRDRVFPPLSRRRKVYDSVIRRIWL